MEDFDIKEFAKMFDAALASGNPAVKKALRNFMMVTALVHSQEEVENDERLAGPLETLIQQIDDLQRRVSRVESERYSTTQTYPASPYDNTWIYNGQFPSSTSSSTSTKSWKDNSSSIDEYNIDVEKYFKNLFLDKGME